MSEKLTQTLYSPQGAAVLKITVSHTERDFYSNIADAFVQTAKTKLYAFALRAYESSTDRRKRYRFSCHSAEFCITEQSDCTMLIIKHNDEILLCEKHYWCGEVLTKRKRLKSAKL